MNFSEKTASISFRRDFIHCPPPEGELGDLLRQALRESFKKEPDNDFIKKVYKRIIAEAPDFYPARFNYAIMLMDEGDSEAVTELRAILAINPDYLFASAALLQYLAEHGDRQAAIEVRDGTPIPDETHPDAWLAWLLANIELNLLLEEEGDTLAMFKQVSKLAPTNPRVIDYKERLGDKLGCCQSGSC